MTIEHDLISHAIEESVFDLSNTDKGNETEFRFEAPSPWPSNGALQTRLTFYDEVQDASKQKPQ